jgi:DNA-directed RNA polymerase subunit K/omega
LSQLGQQQLNNSFFFMNSILLDNASKVVPNIGILVNMVRQRVRQLLGGARPLIAVPPGLGLSDIALSEIAAEKLVSEPVLAVAAGLPAATIVNFPGPKAA